MGKQRVKDIYLEILSDYPKKGHLMYYKDFSFQDLVNWVYRNCGGCNNIKIIPGEEVQAEFDDRIEIYTMQEKEVSDFVQIDK